MDIDLMLCQAAPVCPISRKLADEKDMVFFWPSDDIADNGANPDSISDEKMNRTWGCQRAAMLNTYPLTAPACVVITTDNPSGINAAEIVTGLRAVYAEIYRIEEAGETVPERQVMDLGALSRDLAALTGSAAPDFGDGEAVLLNRPATNGAFGIWGHTITDLIIEHLAFRMIDHEGEYTYAIKPGISS